MSILSFLFSVIVSGFKFEFYNLIFLVDFQIIYGFICRSLSIFKSFMKKIAFLILVSNNLESNLKCDFYSCFNFDFYSSFKFNSYPF